MIVVVLMKDTNDVKRIACQYYRKPEKEWMDQQALVVTH